MFGNSPVQSTFNTDYWGANYGDLFNPAVQGTTQPQGHPALPALWWLGAIIALVIIRVAYSRME